MSWDLCWFGIGLYLPFSLQLFHLWGQFFSLCKIFSYVYAKCVPVASTQAMPSPLCSAMSNSESFINQDLFFKAAGSGTGGCGSPILRASGQIWHFTRSEYSLIGAGCCGFLGLCGFWGRHCSPFLVVGFLADPWAIPLGIICFSSSIKGGDAQEQGCCPRLSKQLPFCCGRR